VGTEWNRETAVSGGKKAQSVKKVDRGRETLQGVKRADSEGVGNYERGGKSTIIIGGCINSTGVRTTPTPSERTYIVLSVVGLIRNYIIR